MVTHPMLNAGAENKLALAVIASSSAPMLLLNGDLRIIAASASFGEAFGYVSPNLATFDLTKI